MIKVEILAKLYEYEIYYTKKNNMISVHKQF